MKTWVKALLVGSLAISPAVAFAAIDNTHHDIQYMGQGQEKCTYCHSKTGIAPNATLGKVGGFCVQVCHLSGSGLSGTLGEVVPTSPGFISAFNTGTNTATMDTTGATTVAIFTSGHGMVKNQPFMAMSTGSGEYDSVTATGWPYTNGDQLECTSCHSVHDASNPPFLNAKLSDATTPQTAGFCVRCHTNAGRVQDFAAAGDHPTEFTWDPTAAAGRNAAKGSDAATIMNGRQIVVATAATNINVMAAGITNASAAGDLNANGTAHWALGGHLVNRTTGLTTDGAAGGANSFGCYSCHAVHGAASSYTSTIANPLTIGNNIQSVCYACHTVEPGVTNYGHPIGTDVSTYANNNWIALPITAAYTGQTATTKPATGAPYCVSCHDVHNALSGRMAIKNIGTLNGDGSVCELCHAASFDPTLIITANEHHPGQASTKDYTGDGFPTQTSWTTTDGHGDLNDGLSCPDCHVGDGTTTKRSTAHNWQ